MALALFGWALGLPLGYALNRALVWLVAEVVNVDFAVRFPPRNLVIALVGTVVLALLVLALRCGAPCGSVLGMRCGTATRRFPGERCGDFEPLGGRWPPLSSERSSLGGRAMDAWMWIVLAVLVLVVLGAVVWFAMQRRRTTQLKEGFGPEYERTVRETGDRRDAEARLSERREKREDLDIRPLSPAACERYAEEWRKVQARFVDEPVGAVAEADRLVTNVMHERGYPMDDFDTQAELVSVDHPDVVHNYREGHDIYLRYDRGDASTEDLRQAMKHYRALFEDLLETDQSAEHERQEVR